MAIKLLGKKIDGKKLGFIALAFSALFCASSLQVYREERAESEAREAIRETIEALPLTSREVGRFQIVHIATHGNFFAKDIDNRAVRLNYEYWATVAILAHEFGHIAKDENQSGITLTSAHIDALEFKAKLDNSLDDYFYERLLLEKRRQEGRLSPSSYQEELSQMLKAYASKLPKSEVPPDEESLRSQLRVAEQQLIQMQTQVNTLKDQLARAERSTYEKWIAIVIAIFSVLIAFSANVIAWRTDRRQVLEAELVSLKRQELEKNIIQKDQQIRESNGRIITPSPQEVKLYSSYQPVDNFEWGKRSKT